ncbi:hypothetical protein Pfo_005495 [Paulownia fortunei]|nr:hypothetical protein Pfo_005495 [Paulownia fortunei]
MMLLDACFIIIHMEASTPEPEKQEPEPMMLQKIFSSAQHLGMLTMTIVLRDLFLLENQIPIWIVKLLIKLRYEKDDGEKLLNRYLNMTLFGEYRKKRSSPHQNREEPLHLLEAFRRLVVSDCVKLEKTYLSFIRRWFCCFRFKEETGADPEIGVNQTTGADPEIGVTDPEIGANQTTGAHQATDQSSRLSKLLSCVHKIRACVRLAKESYEDDAKRDIKKYVHSFRSATDLKAKGIHFKPSSTQSLMDVKFKSKFIYAQLELPTWGVSIYTKVFFLNMIAYELSPNNPNMGEVTSYINLMKSLIESPADVKELREKKILYNMLGSDEEVLNVYKDINTYGANNPHIFQDVKDKIQAHYNSKTKTWIAELIHTHFRTPWTLITLLAAMVLLALTAVQVHYAIPHKSNK